MSFRTRIALAASAAVAVAVVLASVTAYLLVRSELRGEVDDSLRETAARLTRLPPGPSEGRCGDARRAFREIRRPLLGGAGGYVQVVAADGSSLRPPGNDLELPVTDGVLAVASGGRAEFSDAEVADVHVRVLTVPMASGIALQVARPLDEVDSVLSQLRLILLFVSVGGVGLAGMLGFAVTRTALTPVRRLTHTTEHIADTGDLTARIEVGGTDELGRLASSFNAMVEALEESQRAQRQLVADASHELRTPLTSLRTNIETLARGGGDAPEERREMLADVTAQLEELTALVADVVDLARDGEQEPVIEDVRLDLLVADAVGRAERHSPDVRFVTELEETLVRGAPARLDRAVGNLLDNAAKWSPPGGTVEVAVRGREVVVRDHGPGIDESDLPFVFDRFYRAPNARGRPGSGLGLAIVRQVVEAHGGTATAERAEDGGARMRLRLG